MTEPPPQHEIAEAIRELARQVDTLGNAVMSAARILAKAIRTLEDA